MQKLVFVVTLAAFSLLTGGAWAKTVLHVTKADVLTQSGNGHGCNNVDCGHTTCNYQCKGSKCTVTINLTRQEGGIVVAPTGNGAR
jgi:hypothetical protein